MKIIFLLFALLICIVVMTQTKKQESVIIITKTTPYCGGANPPEEILAEAKKKKIPFGEKFYIFKGTKNRINRIIIDSVVLDSSGKWLTQLKQGCYSIIDTTGYHKINVDSTQYDLKCITELWERPLFTFKVSKDKSETYSLNIEEQCPHNKPCYKGEIPLPM